MFKLKKYIYISCHVSPVVIYYVVCRLQKITHIWKAWT